MISFQNKNSYRINALHEKERTVSTLLIPGKLVKPLKEKMKLHGNFLTAYLRNLLKRFRVVTYSGMIPHPKKIKTEYQEEGLDLQRVNFRVFNEDWIELGELAIAFGKSRCYIFTFLLEIDLLGLWDILLESGFGEAVPTQRKLRLQVLLSLWRFTNNFARTYHVRV